MLIILPGTHVCLEQVQCVLTCEYTVSNLFRSDVTVNWHGWVFKPGEVAVFEQVTGVVLIAGLCSLSITFFSTGLVFFDTCPCIIEDLFSALVFCFSFWIEVFVGLGDVRIRRVFS